MGIQLPRKVSKSDERSEKRDFFVPDGTYLCKLLSYEEKPKGDTGETFMQSEFEILDAKKGDGKDAIGLHAYDILNLNEASMWRVTQFLDAIHGEVFEGEEIPNGMEEKWIVLKLKNEKYQGKENLRVKEFNSAANWSGITMKTNDDGQEIVSGGSSNGSKSAPSGGGKKQEQRGKVSI